MTSTGIHSVERHHVAAIVPMRHHSERVPRKNYRMIAGRPLYEYIIETLLACESIASVYIDTDSELIRDHLEQRFPQVHLLERPKSLSGPDVPMNDVLAHTISQIEADCYLQTHTTNPLLSVDTVERALRAFTEARDCDSLFSVTPVQKRFWDRSGNPLNHDPNRLQRTQDLSALLEENSCLYLFSRTVMRRLNNRIGEHPLLFEISLEEAWDIDTDFDFKVAELLLLAAYREKRP